MLGMPGGEDAEATKQMANSQVASSFIQFVISVGVINLAPYILSAIMGEDVLS